jgi:lysyl-tRNA synthetase class 2
LNQAIRAYFAAHNVLEVETPVLGRAGVTDVHLEPFVTRHQHQTRPLYLLTSPEYPMKRLLAAGSGPIYQLGKAFRNEDAGRLHNPEFTLLEWYRPGFGLDDLMDDMDRLLQTVAAAMPAQRMRYAEAFRMHVGLDPLTADLTALRAAVPEHSRELAARETDRDVLLNLLFSMVIEPQLGMERPCFIHRFPASQAALARLTPDCPQTAERFEVYWQGVELANGFDELTDAAEQRRRFEADNALRRRWGRPEQPVDEGLLAALAHGMPPCSGVALGIDRLLMLMTGAHHIDEVLSFSLSRL